MREIGGALRRQLWLIVGATALAGAGTFYLLRQEVPKYGASAMVRLVDSRAAMAGTLGDAVSGSVVRSDPLLSEILVLKGRGVLGQVVDREGLRVTSATAGFAVGALRDVHVALPPDQADTVHLRFSPEGVIARAGGERVQSPYGAPFTVAGVSLSLPAVPQVDAVTLAVTPREDAVDQVASALDAKPRQGTDAIEIQYTSSDPQLAVRVVNAAAEVFQAANTRSAQQQAVRRRMFLEQQISEVDSVLADAQFGLSRFRSRGQVYSSSERLTAQQAELTQLEMRREEMDAERRLYQALLEKLLASGGATRAEDVRALMSAPGIATNPVIAQLFGQLVQYQTDLDALTTGVNRKSDTNPDVERLRLLLASTEARLASAVRGHVATMEARVAALDQMRARSGARMQRLPDAEAEELRLTQQVETARAAGEQLRAELQKARISEAVEAGQVEVVNLAVRARQVPSQTSLKLGLGLALGLMLGTGGALLREQMNNSVRRQEEIEPLLRIPSMAVIPQIQPAVRRTLDDPILKRLSSAKGLSKWRSGKGASPALVAANQLQSPAAEAYRTLRTNLVFSQAVQSLQTLVVTSAYPGEGKSTTAANLAATFAQMGTRVLLLDCDLRGPSLHKMLNIPNQSGLTNVLLEQATLQEAICLTELDNLHILPSGTLPPNPYELLAGERMRNLLHRLSAHYDMLIIDTPPLAAASDAAVLGAAADGVLMVLRAGATDRDAAQHAREQLAAVRARVVGAVLNDPDAVISRYGRNYYRYNYYSHAA